VPRVRVLFYADDDGRVPARDWLDSIAPKARIKCYAALRRLAELGFELRRPSADYLRDGIYELRIGQSHVNYRLLYFFHDREVVVVTHGLVKEKRVPPKEIDLAIERRDKHRKEPARRSFFPDVERLG
jgi:phage-related protein